MKSSLETIAVIGAGGLGTYIFQGISRTNDNMVLTGAILISLIAILAEQAVMDVSDIRMEDTLQDLGLDSLGLVESIFAIEEAFDISVPFNANEPGKSDFDISSVAAIIAAVESLVSRQQAA